MKRCLYRLFVLCVFILFTGITLSDAAAQDVTEDVEAQIDDEFRWLQEEAAVVMTEIATRTRMDADLVPGMVTVLMGEDLESRGIRTVYEALTLVPGLNLSRTNVGYEQVIVRGVGGGYFSGNLKILLNGVALNDTMSAAGYAIYNIPAEQIDRIEIIRGPGSVIYGEYAYAGVVSVTTRKDTNRVYGSYDSNRISDSEGGNDRYNAGGMLAYTSQNQDFRLNLNIAGWESDRSDTESGKDKLASLGLGGASGTINDAQESRLLNLTLDYKGFSLSGQYALSGRGDYFGFLFFLPPEDEDKILQTHEHWGVEGKQRIELSDLLKIGLTGGWRRYKNELTRSVAIPPGLYPPYGAIGGSGYAEREIYGGAELICENRFLLKNTLLLGVKYSDVGMEDVWSDSNEAKEGSLPYMTRYRGELAWMQEDRERRILSLYGEDMLDITDRLAITLGLRYDDYDDMGSHLSPRGAAVWRLTDHHILKAQYAEAFRPPTFSELHSQTNGLIAGNSDLESEHIRTAELGYIFRNPMTTLRLTLSHSELKDNIEHPATSSEVSDPEDIRYVNGGDIRMKGLELEFEQKLGEAFRLKGNLSFADTEDSDTGEAVEGSADWLGNMGLMYRPWQDYTFSLQYRYVGKRHRGPADDRDDLDALDTLDFTAGFQNLFTRGFSLRTGIKNLFDTDIRYLAPAKTYPDDFPGPGREYRIEISYELN